MKVTSVPVSDMVGRVVANVHGAEFRVVSVRYDLEKDMFIVWVAEIGEHGEDSGEEEGGLHSLKGWTLY